MSSPSSKTKTHKTRISNVVAKLGLSLGDLSSELVAASEEQSQGGTAENGSERAKAEQAKAKLEQAKDAQKLKNYDFKPGDTVRVHARIIEGNKERIQVFEGVVIKRHKRNQRSATFTVRKISYSVGVERTFLLHSPRIEKIEIVSRGIVRRARLFYLRDTVGKAGRIKTDRVSEGSSAEEGAENNGSGEVGNGSGSKSGRQSSSGEAQSAAA